MNAAIPITLLATVMSGSAADRLIWTEPAEDSLLRVIVPDQGMRGLKRVSGEGEGIPLPEGAPRILWAGVLPPDLPRDARALVAIGNFGPKNVGIEEWLDPARKEEAVPQPWPAGVAFGEWLHWESFGREERVTLSMDGPTAIFQAAVGKAPAGAASNCKGLLPSKAWCPDRSLHLSFQGQGKWQLAAEFDWEGKDPLPLATLEAGPVLREQAVAMDKLPGDRPFRLALIAPEGGGSLRLSGRYGSTTPPVAAARWDWSTKPGNWPRDGARWQELAAAYPRDMGELSGDRAGWRDQLKVSAVEGDPAMILPGEAPKLAERIGALASLEPAWRPDAIQLDIEPYILPGYASRTEHWNQRWLETLKAARSASKGLPLEVVLPWWATIHPGMRPFLEKLPGTVDRVVVMNYRTDATAALQTAASWMEWGARHRVAVAMAVEMGPLPDSATQRFETAGQGTLWLVDAPPAGTLAILFEKDVPSPAKGRLMRASGPTQVRPSGVTTFHGKPDAALAMIRSLASVRPALPEKARPVFVHEPPGDFAPSAAGD